MPCELLDMLTELKMVIFGVQGEKHAITVEERNSLSLKVTAEYWKVGRTECSLGSNWVKLLA